MTRTVSIDFECFDPADPGKPVIMIGFDPKLIETTYTDLARVEQGYPLAACEITETHTTVRKAVAAAKRLIRARRAWMDIVELRIANRVAVADDVITNLEEIYDVSLDHAIEWSKAFRRAGTTKKWHQEIRMEPLT